VLPNLSTLSLGNWEWEDFSPLLDVIVAVNLKSLAIIGPAQNSLGWSSWDHLHGFLRRSHPRLEKLQLEGVPTTPEELVDSLKLVPTIVNLRLDGRSFDHFLVSRLVWQPDVGTHSGDNILSSLRSLIVIGSSTSYVSARAFVHMVYSRLRYSDGASVTHAPNDLGIQRSGPTEFLREINLATGILWGRLYQHRMILHLEKDPLLYQFREKGDIVLRIPPDLETPGY